MVTRSVMVYAVMDARNVDKKRFMRCMTPSFVF